MTTPPEQITAIAKELGFKIVGWDETSGGLVSDGIEFVGTHAEIMAYLHGWLGHLERGTASYSLLSLRSGGPYTSPPGSGILQPGSTVQVTSRPQRGFFRGERVAIPDSIARFFEIVDITVGNNSCMPQAQRISGELLAARIDQRALIELSKERGDGPFDITITDAARAEFGLQHRMGECLPAMDITVVASLKHDAPPSPFEILILGTEPPDPAMRYRPTTPGAPRSSPTPLGKADVDALIARWQDILGSGR